MPSTKALDRIAEICGVPDWNYPGQVVNDVLLLLRSPSVLIEAIRKHGKEIGWTHEDLSENFNELALVVSAAAKQERKWAKASHPLTYQAPELLVLESPRLDMEIEDPLPLPIPRPTKKSNADRSKKREPGDSQGQNH